MKFFLLFCFPILVFQPVSCRATSNQLDIVLVNQVYDGDTFSDGSKSFRLFGIDTPESFDSDNNFAPTTGLQYFYAAKASQFLTSQILNQEVIIQRLKIDMYQRVIAKVYDLNKNDLALLLVEQGLARVAYISLEKGNPFYTDDYDYYDALVWRQFNAKQNKVGFWANESEMLSIFPR